MKSKVQIATSPLRQVFLVMSLLFALVLLITLALMKLIETVTIGNSHAVDTEVLQNINTYSSPLLDRLFTFTTHLGDKLTIVMSSVAIGVWLYKKRRFYSLAFFIISLGGAALINLLLKSYFARPRPELWERLITETSFSFPSGHAMASSALALTLVIILWHSRWRWPVVAGAALYSVMVGVSRLYLGVHYPTDVLAGWLASAGWVGSVALVLYAKYHWPRSFDHDSTDDADRNDIS